MNKTALKNFATTSRRELLKKVEAKALKIGISKETITKAEIESSDAIFIDGRQLSKEEKIQRDKLISRINQIGFNRVIEEVAYTWFNRFTALRFMEVNNYLPTKVRVLSSSDPNSAEPDMMKEALSIDLHLDKELVYEWMVNNNTGELFKYLIIKHCNDLNRYMPFMFETIDDYTEILFPEGLLAKESFIRQMTNTEVIPEGNWEKVEIIGWLYQYYISEKKDKVFADLKKNIKITKETLPAATQLFTPNWIVRYMVENSLGRLWLESYPNSALRSDWKYYLEVSNQEDEIKKKLDIIGYKNVNPEDITFLDPCCGSGHILVYAFDVLYQLYLEKGYINHEIPKLILEKNLFGLDIDDRAAQLASFAVMMKAREKSRRVFNQDINLNICAIQESNWITEEVIEILVDKEQEQYQQMKQIEMIKYLKGIFEDAKEYGSMISVDLLNVDLIVNLLNNLKVKSLDLIGLINKQKIEEKFPLLLLQTKILSKKYDVVCTNPPYMGSNNMNNYLKDFVQSNFEDSKADVCAVFIEAGMSRTKKNGYCSLVTMHSWMFLSSFEALRKKILDNFTITSILHLGMEAFDGIIGKVVQTGAFVIKNHHISEYRPTGVRLVDYYDGKKHEKEKQFFNSENTYATLKQKDFKNIPGFPIAYWVSQNMIGSYTKGINLGEVASPKTGMTTADNNRFLRLWYEVLKDKIGFDLTNHNEVLLSKKKWFPYSKGGGYRKWKGFDEYLVNWEDGGYEIKNNQDSKGKRLASVRSEEKYFKPCITWSAVTSYKFSSRVVDNGRIFDSGGSSIFPQKDLLYLQGLLNSKITETHLAMCNPTLNIQPRDISNIPVIYPQNNEIKSRIEELVQECCLISKADWDSFETSWDFKKHPLLNTQTVLLKEAIYNCVNIAGSNFKKLKDNEVEINQIFIDIYDLKSELIPNVEDKDITVNKGSILRDTIVFISYAIGCMFGRYSLDEEGLIYAGGEFDPNRYQTFKADNDNILPILPSAYFEDDIISKFIKFVRVTFSEDTLSENLDFIADTLGKKKHETAKETIRRYLLNDFFKNHVQVYKKRPIYWLFTSGKEKAFNCLIYMHRYDKTTLSRIRTDYLHEYQIRLDAERNSLVNTIEGDSTTKEISNAKKEMKSLDKKIVELKEYDELLGHMADRQIEIDLDDGVVVNYEKFQGLVAKI